MCRLGKRSRSKGPKDDEDAAAFMAERVVIDKSIKGNKRKQLAGKNLVYAKERPEIQRGLDESRKTEWKVARLWYHCQGAGRYSA